MTRRLDHRCRTPGPAGLCDLCAADHARQDADVRRAVFVLWGAEGVRRWETQLRADRLARHRAARIKFLDRRST